MFWSTLGSMENPVRIEFKQGKIKKVCKAMCFVKECGKSSLLSILLVFP